MGHGDRIESFRDLIAWQKAMNLVKRTYECTRGLPADERFGLTAQMRRSAISIPSNVAEGRGKGSTLNYLRHLRIARGSAHELSTQSEICHMLGYAGDFDNLVQRSEEVARIINGLIRSVSRSDK